MKLTSPQFLVIRGKAVAIPRVSHLILTTKPWIVSTCNRHVRTRSALVRSLPLLSEMRHLCIVISHRRVWVVNLIAIVLHVRPRRHVGLPLRRRNWRTVVWWHRRLLLRVVGVIWHVAHSGAILRHVLRLTHGRLRTDIIVSHLRGIGVEMAVSIISLWQSVRQSSHIVRPIADWSLWLRHLVRNVRDLLWATVG